MSDHPMPVGLKLTVEELWAMCPDEDGLRHELIDGEHFVTPTPVTRHQLLVGRLSFEIELYLRAHPGVGQLFGVPLDVVLSAHDVVEPDLILIASDQMEILTPKNVQGAPALVIEVLSPSTRRRLNRIDVHRRGADGALTVVHQLEASADAVLTTPILPGFDRSLGRLFA